jgi:uncharacterized protein HemX
MKKLIFIVILGTSIFLSGLPQQVKKDSISSKQDTIKIDTTKKLTDAERKKLEYLEYQKKQRQINKNFEKMDKSMNDLDRQSAVMDSILKKIKK